MRIRLTVLGVAVATMALAAQQPEGQLPRFRAGANLVRVDTYVSVDGVALTDLKPADVEIFEDDKPQRIENLELIEARVPNPQSERTDPTSVRAMRQEATDAARVFTLFFDRFHVSLSGSYHAQKPIVETLERLIGPGDLVGVMTPEISASSITYSRRTSSIERIVTDTWFWGQKGRLNEKTPHEEAIRECYPGAGATRGLADAMIARLREQQTLEALDGLVTHLDGLRPERKFVMVFTEGWALYQRDENLGRVLGSSVPGQDPLGTDPRTGGIRRPGSPDPQSGRSQTFEACERERVMLAFIDHQVEFRELLQRANRANVSFYPIDARGLVVFDQPDRWDLPFAVDNAWLRRRHDDLKMMAEQTDGVAVLDTGNIAGAMQKMFTDVGSYYLATYYSSNPKLDGRFRRIRVEVKRENVEVRARPGYLAPTEAEARSAGATTDRPAGSRAAPPPTVTRALDAIAPGRGNLPVRIQAAGGRGLIRAVVELDAATAKQPEWISGGILTFTVEPERANASAKSAPPQTVTLAIEPGQRSITVNGTAAPVAAGRYLVRAEITPRAGRIPLQVSTFVTVPAETAVIGSAALALRRGPSTGLAYVATADPRFRRTERLRIEVPLAEPATEATGRMLTREGQPMPLIVTYSSRVDEATQLRLGVADVTLSALAAGEYVLEFTIKTGSQTEVITYGFRLIP